MSSIFHKIRIYNSTTLGININGTPTQKAEFILEIC